MAETIQSLSHFYLISYSTNFDFGIKDAITKPIKLTIDKAINIIVNEGNSNNLRDKTGAIAVPINSINVFIER